MILVAWKLVCIIFRLTMNVFTGSGVNLRLYRPKKVRKLYK